MRRIYERVICPSSALIAPMNNYSFRQIQFFPAVVSVSLSLGLPAGAFARGRRSAQLGLIQNYMTRYTKSKRSNTVITAANP